LQLIQFQEVWKEDGTNCYNQLYLVQDKIGQIGTNIMYIKKRDKKKELLSLLEILFHYMKQNSRNINHIMIYICTAPLCGIVNAYWVKDF